jgi:hypothetical protein
MKLLGGEGAGWFYVRSRRRGNELSLVRRANFSGTQGIFIPVMRLVNNGGLPRAGFTGGAGHWLRSACRGTIRVIFLKQ